MGRVTGVLVVTAPVTPPRNGGIVPPWLQWPIVLPIMPTPPKPETAK